MEGCDQAGENRTFRINFGSEGTTRLRERVKEKLKEVMGDYIDDSLVDYVLVLLRNGRTKDEARSQLDAFLGDDSDSFVSWLWDHLSSNFHLYAQSKESISDDKAQISRTVEDQRVRHVSQQEYAHGNEKPDSGNESEKLSKTSRSRHIREWKRLAQEDSNPFPLRSTVTKILHSEERNNVRPNIKQSLSPKPQIGKKRNREEIRPQLKKDAASHPVIGASCRLLQFAVRDAVRTVQQAKSRTEPALKRLRSVVSASTEEYLLDKRPQRLRSVARLPGAFSTALKAAAEAAEDVTKDRYTGSVFDRLSRGSHALIPAKQSSVEPMLEDGEYEEASRSPAGRSPESTRAEHYERNEYDEDFTGNMTMLERVAVMPDDSASDNDDNVGGVRDQGLNTSQIATSTNKNDKSLTLPYSIAEDADEIIRNSSLMDQDPIPSVTGKASNKITDISVNVNEWKPPRHQVPGVVNETENLVAAVKTDVTTGTTDIRLPKEKGTAIAENDIARADARKEPQKTLTSTPGSYSTSRPSDDVDSRTVFVSNVHFAASKDSLSRHFNKFGEVLKVIIVNDAATGQPKGSAYVEFLRKESAESALSLSGTSFMSRSLKVVRKSSMQHEATAMMGWPRISRASSFASRLSRAAFSRGVLPGAFRARLPIKSGARSLQWKRETTAAQTSAEGTIPTQSASLMSGNNAASPTGRNLTYVRTEPKDGATSGQA